MPRVRRRVLVRLDTAPAAARHAAIRVLGVEPAADDTLAGPLFGDVDPVSRLHVDCSPDGAGTLVRLEAGFALQVPYFGWFVRLLAWFAAPRALRHAAARLRADVTGEFPPEALRRSRLLPPVTFTAEEAARVAAIAAVGALANFGGALLTQNGDAVTRTFDRSDQALGLALALIRVGVLVSLIASALSDRWGRRRMILVCLSGMCVMNAFTAAAPSFEAFAGAQLLTRALVNATLVVAAVAAVEEAPEGARAFAFSMYGLAIGVGFAAAVVLLPLADLGDQGWRLAFAVSALSVVLLPGIARNLRETRRFTRLVARTRRRGRLLEPFDRRYGGRFVLLGLVAFLGNVFSAPSGQLMNRYLTKIHDFSNSQVALFRGVTAGLPGFAGLILGGRLAESRGRRPVAIVGLIIASLFQMVFFLGDGALLWLMPTIAIVATACAGLAVGTMGGELFPTEARGTSNGFLLVCGVTGSVTGLLLATRLAHLVGGLGPGIALCAVAPLVAALFVVPRLPETRARTLDEISPSEV